MSAPNEQHDDASNAASEVDDSVQVPAGFPSRQLPPKKDSASAAAGPVSGASASSSSSSSSSTDVAKPAKADIDQQTKQIEELLRNITAGAATELKNQKAVAAAASASGLNLQAIQEQLGLRKPDKNIPKGPDAHKFWGTQPVPQHDEKIEADGPIEPDKSEEEIRKEPLPLPKEYEWYIVDVNNDEELKELYTLLTENYVEDDDAMFRFDYSASFLKWGLQPPGWKKEWHLAVRVKEGKKKLVAFISAIPSTIRVRDHKQFMVEINFLCVHKKLRSKRLAPVLIKEITRRVHLTNCFQAVYTAGVLLPKPVASCKYYHRSINPKKLVETGFSHLGKNMTIQRLQRLYKLPDNKSITNFRRMTPTDVPEVQRLLDEFLKRYDVAPAFSSEEVQHWFVPIEGVVESFVAEDPTNPQHITDFVSFYSLPSSVINNDKHRRIEAAYLFYYASESLLAGAEGSALEKGQVRLQEVVRNGLIEARDRHYDVFNCLDLMDNSVFLDELKFGKGDGTLHYYLYNFRARAADKNKMGLVLL